MDLELRFEPVTADRWNDFETLFGPQGAFSNCWCVALRLPHAERIAMSPLERKAHIHGRIAAGPPPGILAYDENTPVGWVQVGPRSDVPQLNSLRTVARPLNEDEAIDPSVWAISCLFLTPKLRGGGQSHRLVAAAIEHARRNGARIVDACPIDHAKQSKSVTLCVGSTSVFDAAGFEIVERRKDGRPLMRLTL